MRFTQVDVFTSRPLLGNPVAVVLDADGLGTEQMQRIAAWTNLSETTFALPPEGPGPAYRLRIFTPKSELPFAGHPTVGSCHALLEAGIVAPEGGCLVQECGAGRLPLRVSGEGPDRWIFVETPEARWVGEHPELRSELEAALGVGLADDLAPSVFANGPRWLFVRLESEAELARLAPDLARVSELSRAHDWTGVVPFAFSSEGEAAVEIRCFAPLAGVPEDPVTGSANAALPACLARAGLLERCGSDYVARQGAALGRDGRVRVRVLDARGRSEIGGQAVSVVRGELRV